MEQLISEIFSSIPYYYWMLVFFNPTEYVVSVIFLIDQLSDQLDLEVLKFLSNSNAN